MVMTALSLDPTSLMAPSELILLNGDKFAKKVMIGNIDLLHTPVSVSAAQLGQAILASAFLACEQTGAIRLETRQKKAMMGLRKIINLYATPKDGVEWPAYSLESKIGTIAGQLQAGKGDNEVSNVIYTWLGEDSGSPWQSAIELVKSGMADRGLLDRLQEKKLKVFSVTRYQLPDKTASLVQEIPIAPLQRLLEDCEKMRPEIWKMLVKQINSAIKARTEQDSSSMDF
jgi:hypothetical protein